MKKLIFTIIIFAAVLTACDKKSKDGIIMGTNAAFKPFEYLMESDGVYMQYSGIDIEISVRIAEALGAELHIRNAEFDDLIGELNNNTIDFIAAAMTINPDRMEDVMFSIPYFTDMQYIVVRIDDDRISNANDLNGLRVGVQSGTTGEAYVVENIDYAELIPYSIITQGLSHLTSRNIDAVVVDSMAALAYMSDHPDQLRLIRDDNAFEHEDYGIAVRHGDTELLDTINEVLNEMLSSGEMDSLFGLYISVTD